MTQLLYKELAYKVQGVLFEVYKIIGPGFKELVYQNAIEEELKLQKIKYIREPSLKIVFKGKNMGLYKPDFIIEDKIILEIKSVAEMPTYFENQLFSYLKASNYLLGLLANFGSDKNVEIKRRIYDTARKPKQ